MWFTTCCKILDILYIQLGMFVVLNQSFYVVYVKIFLFVFTSFKM